MWCRDLTECLDREDINCVEALEAFEKVNFEVSSLAGGHCTCEGISKIFMGNSHCEKNLHVDFKKVS